MSETYRAKVRMYRQGLGDCFLITLPREGGSPYRIMIDCGLIQGAPNATDAMRAVVDDIVAATGDGSGRGKIDLVVGTHQHWDHLSGFVQAKDTFARIDVGAVWLAWTEDPNDAQAKRLAAQRGTALRALQVAETRLRLAERDDDADGVSEILTSFFGVRSGGTIGDALEAVRGLAHPKPPRYCAPSDDPVTPEGTSVRIFVLGPPRDENLLKKSSIAASSPEVYGVDALFGVDGLAELEPALTATDPESPFGPMQTIPLTVAQQLPFFKRRYWGGEVDPAGEGAAWRRIDSDFLESSTQLALQLDSATNNTSLALAIELAGGDVLLFPADAQIGSWLSWQSLSWKIGDATVTGPKLLARTIFYKVGHHGSHNATLKAHGLELMSALRYAMIPVNETMAHAKHWDRMPLEALLTALAARAHDGVIRADKELPAGIASVASAPDGTWYEVTL
jgi:hypothetical protein